MQMRLWKGIHCRRRIISVSDAAFPLFLTAFLSFPDPIRDLVRPRKTVRIREAFLFLMGKQPLPIGPDVESVVDGSLRKRIHRTAHISALPCVGEEPVLPFQLFREKSRCRRDSHDGHKDGEAGPGRSREIHRLCPHTAWKDRPGRHRQTSSVFRTPSERGEAIEIRGTEGSRG